MSRPPVDVAGRQDPARRYSDMRNDDAHQPHQHAPQQQQQRHSIWLNQRPQWLSQHPHTNPYEYANRREHNPRPPTYYNASTYQGFDAQREARGYPQQYANHHEQTHEYCPQPPTRYNATIYQPFDAPREARGYPQQYADHHEQTYVYRPQPPTEFGTSVYYQHANRREGLGYPQQCADHHEQTHGYRPQPPTDFGTSAYQPFNAPREASPRPPKKRELVNVNEGYRNKKPRQSAREVIDLISSPARPNATKAVLSSPVIPDHLLAIMEVSQLATHGPKNEGIADSSSPLPPRRRATRQTNIVKDDSDGTYTPRAVFNTLSQACSMAIFTNENLRKEIAAEAYIRLRQARPNLLPWGWQQGIEQTNTLIDGAVFGDCTFIEASPNRVLKDGKNTTEYIARKFSWTCTICHQRHKANGVKTDIYTMLGCGLLTEDDWALYVVDQDNIGFASIVIQPCSGSTILIVLQIDIIVRALIGVYNSNTIINFTLYYHT